MYKFDQECIIIICYVVFSKVKLYYFQHFLTSSRRKIHYNNRNFTILEISGFFNLTVIRLINSQTYTFKSSKESTLSKIPSTASEVVAVDGGVGIVGEVAGEVVLKVGVDELILEVASSITMSM